MCVAEKHSHKTRTNIESDKIVIVVQFFLELLLSIN